MSSVVQSLGVSGLVVALAASTTNCSGSAGNDEHPTNDSGAEVSGQDGAVDAHDAGSPLETTDAGTVGQAEDAGRAGDAGAPADSGTMDASGSPSSIDLSMWMLELPIGSGTSPTTIPGSQLAAGFSDAYFYRADAGVVFMDPATGITTMGSVHCRSELHEDDSSGKGADWTSAGTNTMTVTGAVLQVGGGADGDVTVAQVFNDTDSITLAELQYSVKRGGFGLFYEEAKGGGGTTDLATPATLKARYTFTLGFSKGQLTVVINGKQVYSHQPSSAVSGNQFFFKVGNYDQTATAGPITTTPYTVVEVDGVDVVHQ